MPNCSRQAPLLARGGTLAESPVAISHAGAVCRAEADEFADGANTLRAASLRRSRHGTTVRLDVERGKRVSIATGMIPHRSLRQIHDDAALRNTGADRTFFPGRWPRARAAIGPQKDREEAEAASHS